MSIPTEISDSLIQEVLVCNELASQWSEQTPSDTADPSTAVEPVELSRDLAPSDGGLVPVAEHRIPESEAELAAVPNPLRQLIATAGVKLVPAPCGTWNIDGYAAKLRRPLSVTFSIDSIVTSEEVLEAVAGAGVGVEEIASIQYRGSNRSWCVSFTTRAAKDRILELGVIKFGNVSVYVGDADFKTVIVKIYEAPPEMPDAVVIGRLSHYGRVLSFRRDVGLATGISNGVRTARMWLTKAIPSSVRIAGEAVFVSYSGQPKTCRRCGEEGHLAQGCRKPRCYNCEAPGHVASDCDLDPLCGVCLRSGHHVFDCPYLILSANVQVNTFPSYADIARPVRPASPVAPPSADQQQRKRKADREQSRSITADHSRDIEGREKVRRRDASRDLEERRHHDRVSHRLIVRIEKLVFLCHLLANMADRKSRTITFKLPITATLSDLKKSLDKESQRADPTVIQELGAGQFLVEFKTKEQAEEFIDSGLD